MSDPIFGEVSIERGGWDATVLFEPTGTAVQVLGHQPGGPSSADQRTFGLLSERYEDLAPRIREALFRVWEPWISEWEPAEGLKLPQNPLELEAATELGAVWLSGPGVERLTYHFAEDGVWDDASMNVGMTDWVPVPLGIDD